MELGPQEFGDTLRGITRSAFRLELQAAYDEPSETETVRRFLAGDPQPPTELPGFVEWFAQIRAQVAAGATIARVRVHDEPPTGYQRWERWIGRWNAEAGERIAYLTRQKARDIGLLPAAGDTDWWLIDDDRLIVMKFDPQHRRISTQLVTDPAAVAQARDWRDLAVQHAFAQGADHEEDTTRC